MDSSTLVPTSAAASTLTLLSALTPVMMLRRLGSSAKGLRSARLVNTVTVSFKSRCILALQMSLFCSPELKSTPERDCMTLFVSAQIGIDKSQTSR